MTRLALDAHSALSFVDDAMKFRSSEGPARVALDPRFPISENHSTSARKSEFLAKQPPRVLLAEDNHDLQQVFAHQLTLLGLEVVSVTNGRDAVDSTLAAYHEAHPFDLVLMDLEMPVIDGYEATRRIRDSGFLGPILALSGHSTEDHRAESLEIGCDDCLYKPLDWNQLARLVRKYLPGHVLPDPARLNSD
jgi:CheY-like chemotaxis protein